MACAVVCSSHHRSHLSTSDVPKQDFFSVKCDLKAVPMRRSSPINAAVRSESSTDRSESSTDLLTGRYSSACVDQPCAPSCPVRRETDMERWVEESAHEIVRNIQEAPFLQYVFNSTSSFQRYSHRQRLSQECFQDWPSLKASLSKADPDGVILVQKLDPGCAAAASCCLGEDQDCPLQSEGVETNVWGVFVQARGSVSTNACYLLKTTRVATSAGACTRYCLTRATCFGPSYVEQLEHAWLL